MRAVEAWLTSEDHIKFGEAMIKCDHAGGFCASDGFCHNDGACFRTGYSAMKAACRAIERAADDQPSDIGAEMIMAARLLRQSWQTDENRDFLPLPA